METIDLIKEVEQKAAALIVEAEKVKEKSVTKAKEDISQKINGLQAELKSEIASIIEMGEKEAKEARDREVEKRAKDIMDLDNAVKKNMGRAVSFIFDKINN